MTAIENFRSTIINWLCSHGFSNIDIDFEKDFGYAIDPDSNIRYINIGIEDFEDTNNYFSQFLFEYGLKYLKISAPVLAFFHELGHHMTLNSFTDEEIWLCFFAKGFDNVGSEQDWYTNYWLIGDEFAANAWEINYINSHIEDVKEFCNIFEKAWSAIFEETTMEDFLNEVA